METIPETFLIVMPAYNESGNIEKTINSWSRVIRDFPSSEILVINDGSTDDTKDKLETLSQKLPHLSIINKENAGHGKSVVLGYRKALKTHHAWIFQTDSDGHFDPEDFYKLWEKRNTSEFVLGYRYKRKDPVDRIIITQLESVLILFLFRKYIKDPNIPFRLMRRDYLEKLLRDIPEDVFAPNIFLSILAARDGQNLYNIPVSHKSIEKSKYHKLKLLRGVFRSFFQLILFRMKMTFKD